MTALWHLALYALLALKLNTVSHVNKSVLYAQESWLGMGGNPDSPGRPLPAAVEHATGAEQDDMMPDWDDEDLLAMQAEPMVRQHSKDRSLCLVVSQRGSLQHHAMLNFRSFGYCL